jgi:basic membrane protein A
MVGLSTMDESRLPYGVVEALTEARALIESGEFGVFDGVMETNDGQTVGAPGKTLPDSEITGGINWYYRNIVEP